MLPAADVFPPLCELPPASFAPPASWSLQPIAVRLLPCAAAPLSAYATILPACVVPPAYVFLPVCEAPPVYATLPACAVLLVYATPLAVAALPLCGVLPVACVAALPCAVLLASETLLPCGALLACAVLLLVVALLVCVVPLLCAAPSACVILLSLPLVCESLPACALPPSSPSVVVCTIAHPPPFFVAPLLPNGDPLDAMHHGLLAHVERIPRAHVPHALPEPKQLPPLQYGKKLLPCRHNLLPLPWPCAPALHAPFATALPFQALTGCGLLVHGSDAQESEVLAPNRPSFELLPFGCSLS
mmetsp:Transcript_135352/g.270089  ORF Transcript_135352/g.270089 Transcript_135352/m.270089 type:complete len:302 (-) Transcript_135352:396-1301(-)